MNEGKFFRAWFYLASLPYLVYHFARGYEGFPPGAVSPLGLLHLPALTVPLAPAAYAACAGAATASALLDGRTGYAARALFFALALWVLGNRYGFGVRQAQVDSPLLLCAFAFVFADFTSERWPAPFARAFLALVMAEAGVAKLLESGAEWLTADPLRTYLLIRERSGRTPSFPEATLLGAPPLTRALSALTILLETSFPLALLSLKARHFYGAALFVFLFGILVTLEHPFALSFLPLLGAFLPISKVCARMGK